VLRLILRNSCITPDTEVYQPELVVHTAWYAVGPFLQFSFNERSGLTGVRVLGPTRHQKQLRSIQAIVGASLPIYAQTGPTGVAVADGPLSNIIREMAEQNELVVGYRARRKRGSRASRDPDLAFVSGPFSPLRTRIGLIPFSPHCTHRTHTHRKGPRAPIATNTQRTTPTRASRSRCHRWATPPALA
jgi:hypothetical protein